MKQGHILSTVLIVIVLVASVSMLASYTVSNSSPTNRPYVGVAFCGNTTAQAEALIERVKDYTNLFVLACGINPISDNLTAAREICDYAVNSGLYVIINLGTWRLQGWQAKIDFINESKALYGDRFLGCYYDDEPGGATIDYDWSTFFNENHTRFFNSSRSFFNGLYNRYRISHSTSIHPDNYTEESTLFNTMLQRNPGSSSLKQNNITTMTSDYALYWFSYLSGYDTMFAQLGWNISDNQQIALVRGAATLQNKDWGTIVTWKYREAPYLDTPANIYNQMKTSYDAGAKYIIIFNHPQIGNDPYGGAMTDAHFRALKAFWTQVVSKNTPGSNQADAALVLPKDYGSGMRTPEDGLWGIWGPDDKTPLVWSNLQTLLNQYGSRLDIVYDDPAFPVATGKYSNVYYWNQTI